MINKFHDEIMNIYGITSATICYFTLEMIHIDKVKCWLLYFLLTLLSLTHKRKREKTIFIAKIDGYNQPQVILLILRITKPFTSNFFLSPLFYWISFFFSRKKYFPLYGTDKNQTSRFIIQIYVSWDIFMLTINNH